MTTQDPFARGAHTRDDNSAPDAGGSPSSSSSPYGPPPGQGPYGSAGQGPAGHGPSGPGPHHASSDHGAAQGAPNYGAAQGSSGYGTSPGPAGHGAAPTAPGHGSGGGGGAPTATLPPPPPSTSSFPSGGGGQPPRRRPRRPLALAAGALAALLVAGGVGGAVGYEAASSGSSGSTSALAGAPDSSSSSSSSAAPAAGSVEAVAQKMLPSVVQLKGASGEGSGIVISADGLILTNAHVLEAGDAPQTQQSPLGGLLGGRDQQQAQPAPGLTAVFQNGGSAPVQVVGTDTTADLAVVRAQGVSNLPAAQIGDSSQLQVGQEVVAVGSPLGLSGTVTSGIVSALQRPVATGGAQSGQASVIDAIQTDAAINPGNSGGALVDMQGRVVGVTSAIASLGSSSPGSGSSQSGSIGLGFAIPINQAARIGDELARTGFANQAVLGVQVSDAQPTGAQLGALTPGGAAASAGLAPGDVVTRVNDRAITDADSLVAAVRAQPPGAQVTMTVSSGGAAPRQVPVTLGSERAPSR